MVFSINETKLHHPSSSFVDGEPFLNILEFPYFHVFPYFHFHVGFHTTGASLVAQTVKNSPALQETWFNPLVRKIPWRREWLPPPVFLPREFHGQRSLAGYSLWECFTNILDCGLHFNFLKNIFEKQFFTNEVQFIILSFLKKYPI